MPRRSSTIRWTLRHTPQECALAGGALLFGGLLGMVGVLLWYDQYPSAEAVVLPDAYYRQDDEAGNVCSAQTDTHNNASIDAQSTYFV
jgi:hypothetical protein